MKIQLNRKGQLSLRKQLAMTIRLKILNGELPHGHKLPSIRSLARRLRIHHNTVAAAYGDLEITGNITGKRGVGFFVQGAPGRQRNIRVLQEMLARALQTACDMGFSPTEIRNGLARWLASRPYSRVLVVDPYKETCELLAKEIEEGISVVPVIAWTVDQLKAADPAELRGALLATLPYYLEQLRAAFPDVPFVALKLQFPTKEIAALPDSARVLIVLHPPRLLRYAAVIFETVHHGTVWYTALPLLKRSEWQAQVRAADVVFTDCIAAAAIRSCRPRRVVEIRIINPASLNELHTKLSFAWPDVCNAMHRANQQPNSSFGAERE